MRGLNMAYEVEGQLLEVCTCNILCPCWVGEDPDNGTCDGLLGWRVTKGSINGTEVAGHSIVALAHIPGNILKGNWKVRMYIDDKASAAQKDAMLAVWSGKLGGPIADMARLIGEVLSVEQVPITFDVKGVAGTLRVGPSIMADLESYKGSTGKDTTLHDSIFTTIPGSPAYVGKATSYQVNLPDFKLSLQGHNAVCGSFRFTG
jgi:hypothetical protein